MASYSVCDRCGKPIDPNEDNGGFTVELRIGHLNGVARSQPQRFGYDLHEACTLEVKNAFDRFVRGAVVNIDRIMATAGDPLLALRETSEPEPAATK